MEQYGGLEVVVEQDPQVVLGLVHVFRGDAGVREELPFGEPAQVGSGNGITHDPEPGILVHQDVVVGRVSGKVHCLEPSDGGPVTVPMVRLHLRIE